MTIRPLVPKDAGEWLRLRRALWPDCADEMHALEMEQYRSDPAGRVVFALERPSGGLGGFAEFSTRERVDGSFSKSVAYVEGWYIEPELRGSGAGRALIEAGQRWAAEQGLTEMASDAEIENEQAILAHRALGFEETFRLVHFLKRLSPPQDIPGKER